MSSNPAESALTKCCASCKNVKPISEFRLRKRENGRRTLRPYCRPCESARFIIWRRGYISKNGVRVSLKNRENYFLKKYGLSQADLALLNEHAGGRCQICGVNKPLHVDHSHHTGKVRGMLCFTCNSALGKFKDDPHLLMAAARYLRKHSSKTKDTDVHLCESELKF